MPRDKKPTDELSPRARFFRDKLRTECEARIALDKQRRELDRTIAALCKQARDEGVSTTRLAAFVSVLDRDGESRRTITRQAVEAMIKTHFGDPAEEAPVQAVDTSVFQ